MNEIEDKKWLNNYKKACNMQKYFRKNLTAINIIKRNLENELVSGEVYKQKKCKGCAK
jgi:hypothetical protein